MAEFIIGECKCGGSVLAEFGFSCSGKPKTSMRCDRCGKVSITIGNNNNPMKLWEEKYSTEYIDRRKLLKKITDIELIISLNRADYKTELIQAVKLYENAILKAILTEPSADVEEVVRCEDCKFLQYGECRILEIKAGGDFYCYLGKRKEE